MKDYQQLVVDEKDEKDEIRILMKDYQHRIVGVLIMPILSTQPATLTYPEIPFDRLVVHLSISPTWQLKDAETIELPNLLEG